MPRVPGQGFSFSVPADTVPTELKVWVYADGGTGTLTAHLSDDSAPDYVDDSIVGGFNKPGTYTVDFNAASPGQTLTVSWELTSVGTDNNSVNANAAVYAVALGAPGDDLNTDFVVDSTDDGQPDFNQGNGVCETDTQGCTLRAAIQEINASSSGGTISSATPDGPQRISVGDVLPPITKPVVIDGTTQAAFQLADGSLEITPDGTQGITLDGRTFETGGGLVLGAGSDGSEVHGLAIQRFSGAGLSVMSDGDVITGNYIGTNNDGFSDEGNDTGIEVTGQNTRIGGPTAADRNVIAANRDSDVAIDGSSDFPVDGTVIEANYIGVDATGNETLSNNDAIDAFGATNTTIGGATNSAGNVVSSVDAPITLEGIGGLVSSGNVVAHNSVGIGADGSTALADTSVYGIGVSKSNNADISHNVVGNIGITEDGITVESSNDVTVTENTVGLDGGGNRHPVGGSGISFYAGSGTIESPTVTGNVVANSGFDGIYVTGAESGVVTGNTIHDNGKDGILLDRTLDVRVGPGNVITDNTRNGITLESADNEGASGRNTITENSIDGNGKLGIDLIPSFDESDGVTANDPTDEDAGPNGLQNFPTLTSVSFSEITLSVQYSLQTAPGDYTVEFFASPAADGSGNGEGVTWLASRHVIVDETGTFTGSTGIVNPGVLPGDAITATATRGYDNHDGTDNRTDTSEYSNALQLSVPGSLPALARGRRRLRSTSRLREPSTGRSGDTQAMAPAPLWFLM